MQAVKGYEYDLPRPLPSKTRSNVVPIVYPRFNKPMPKSSELEGAPQATLHRTNRRIHVWQKLMELQHGMNTFFLSSDAKIVFEIDGNTGLYAIDISVTYSWLMEAFDEPHSTIRTFTTELNEKPYPALLLESSSPSEYSAVASDLKVIFILKQKFYY